MAHEFTVALALREPPEEAQAQAAAALVDPAHAVGLRLVGRRPGELAYGPRVRFPFVLMLWARMRGERMTVAFAPVDGGTRVTIAGAVARPVHPLAADPEHWSGPLGATPV